MNNLRSKTDRKQQTIGYGYDALYRLTGKTYPDQRRMVSGGEWCQSAISLSQTKWFLTPFSPDPILNRNLHGEVPWKVRVLWHAGSLNRSGEWLGFFG